MVTQTATRKTTTGPNSRSQGHAPESNAASRRTSVAMLRERAAALMQIDIDFIDNPAFAADDAEQQIPSEQQASHHDTSRDSRLPRDLPGHLARLCEAKLLTAEEETRLFRRMNFAKFRADAIRGELNLQRPNRKAVEQAETYWAEAQAIRDRIVRSNMRLVMSIVKKFVTPQHSFDEMLSDGIFSLVQATEKFDYDRGFRFSTYAYRAIARNAFRQITDRQKENARFSAQSEDTAFDAMDESGSSSVYDEAWDRMRGVLSQMMDRLDRRERFIIRSRYALGAHRKVRTFQCLADKLGVSKERVRQLEQRAVAKLQALAAEQEMDEVVGPIFS